MAKAANRVIAGDYLGKPVILTFGVPSINVGFAKTVNIAKPDVENYELVTDEHRKSASSGIARGLVGGFLFGGVGMVAGAVSAKNKGIYQVAIQFADGKKSLIEVDDKIYKAIIQKCF